MYSFLYKVYFIKFKNQNIDRLYQRLTIRVLNILLPVIFKIFPGNNNSIKKEQGNKKPEYIVSLTTFPARINKVWLAIESILRQKEKPDKIILWLYEGEFNGKESLPKILLKLERRGLEIRFCDENLKPHNKYFYTMQEFPEANVITVDDDMFYPPDLIEKLKNFHQIYPNCIISTIIRKIIVNGGIIMPYGEWTILRTNTLPSYSLLTMGVGGALFPSESINKEVFNLSELKERALTADDLWLKVMSLKNETKVVGIAGEFVKNYVPIIFKNNKRLMDINIGEGENDRIFETLMNYYKIPLTIFDQ
ncbi:MAG: hypothetical protein KBG40_04475 [Bacteroidales bacterium]|nr:hypothetical protein [Bacteroidales bacterium]